jgi:O-antigen ligase
LGNALPIRSSLVLAAVCALTVAAYSGRPLAIAGTAFGVVVVAAATSVRTSFIRWEYLIGSVTLVVLFVPIKRYKFVVNLPFDLELYRVVLAFVIGFWLLALLVDRRVRLRGSFLDKPLGLFLVAIFGSIFFNLARLVDTPYLIVQGTYIAREELSADVLKKVLFLVSFYLVFYLIVSVVRDERAILRILRFLVGGSAFVGFFGIVEARTGYNLFDHLRSVLPILQFEGALTDSSIARGGRLRVYASSQHPIGLATLLVMIIPLAIFLWRTTRHWVWGLASGAIFLGAISTVSRTSITTMVAVVAVYVWLRPADVRKLWPLIVPAVVVIHLALPGAIGGIQGAFFPSEGIVENQTQYGGRVSGQRVGPVWNRIENNPAFGQGYGTRITEAGLRQNAQVLDNEWLGTTSETGFVGLAAWAWFFARFIRRSGREAKRDRSPRGDFLVAAASAVTAFAVSMLTFDAFFFIQVTFVMYVIAALGVCAVETRSPWRVGARAPVRVLPIPAPSLPRPRHEVS